MDSIVEAFINHAQHHSNALFGADMHGNEFTYGEAYQKVKDVANCLQSKFHIEPGNRVMVECNQDLPFLILDMACELVGAVFVPVEGDASHDRFESIARETESVLCVYRNNYLTSLNSVSYDEILREKNLSGKEIRDSFPKGENIAEILYTTGTTGKSKGIAISNRANIALAENIMYGVEMKPGNIEGIPVPISHSHGLRCCYANILKGGAVLLIDGLLKIKIVFEYMQKYQVTALDLSPYAVMLFIKLAKETFWQIASKLDYIQVGTAHVSEQIKEQLANNLEGVRLYNFYGSTESGRSCVLEFSKYLGKKNCIGLPTINSEIAFTNDNRMIIRATHDKPGLLASKGAMNMVGYWDNESLTKEVMRDNYLFTNDLGYMDSEGFVYVLGRKDDVINYNGIKISPIEIEEVVNQFPDIQESACVPMQDSAFGQAPKIFIVIKQDCLEFNMQLFICYLKEHIDGNKMPKKIQVIKEIPKTSNGKIKRRDLWEL